MDDRPDPLLRTRALPAGQEWWKRAVFYQLSPRSFQDTDGDGVGDLGGVLRRLAHLDWLGVDAVWLCPIFPTPNADFGYDISDYTGVDPQLGTIDQLDELIARLHERAQRLLLDFVPNHTSDQHPWFQESRSSRDNPKRDWYVWRDARPHGSPPNNWLSRFGGSAWEWDEATGQFYYHAFLKQQPDLNWANPEVRAAMHKVLRFWLDRGVDGFRVDASAVLAEDPLLRDDPPNPDAGSQPPPEAHIRAFSDNRPETLGWIEEIRKVVDEYPDRVLLAEVQTADGQLAAFHGSAEHPRFHMPLNYRLLDVSWDAASLHAGIDRYLRDLPEGAWPNWVLGSHDKPRIRSRVGADQAANAAMLLFTLPGSPVFYAGDEIGMPDVEVPTELATDPFERLIPGWGLNRDPHRAPFRWDASEKAGFTTGEPFLPVGGDLKGWNLADQKAAPRSLLQLYRQLIELRHRLPVLRDGRYEPLAGDPEVLSYRRVGRGQVLTVALNLTAEPRAIATPPRAHVLLSTCLDREGAAPPQLELRPHEGVVLLG